MGLSSNARLLSLTARLTSNEYESQQISNAKTRLAVQSQQASEDYINALNSTSYNFVSFEQSGDMNKTKLSADALYQYADSKNQYMLSNSSGKALVSSFDAKNFRKSASLVDFLECYGLEPQFKTDNLRKYYQEIVDDMDTNGSCKSWNETLAQIKKEVDEGTCNWTSEAWQNMAYGDGSNPGTFEMYRNVVSEYNAIIDEMNYGEIIDLEDVNGIQRYMQELKEDAENCASYNIWLEAMARSTTKDAVGVLDSLNKSAEVLFTPENKANSRLSSDENFDMYDVLEIINEGIQENGEIPWDKIGEKKSYFHFVVDPEKKNIYYGGNMCAMWLAKQYSENSNNPNLGKYLNDYCFRLHQYFALKNLNIDLVFSLNKLDKFRENLALYQAELENIGIDAKDAYTYQDQNKAQWYTNLWYRMNGASTVKNPNSQYNYEEINSKLASSSDWVINALKQGVITIEHASASNSDKTLQDTNNPILFNLRGVNWTTKPYSSCSDIIEGDNSEAIAKAEAQYKHKTAEITAKDEKYQRKLSKLDSEHTALQTEYESVKNAVSKNIDRSFKTFQG